MHESHTLEKKFEAMEAAGHKNAVLGFAGYMAWVRSLEPNLPASTCRPEWIHDDEPDNADSEIWDALYRHTDTVRALAKRHGLEIIIFQPLSQYEGWSVGSERSEWVRRKAELWLGLCERLGVGYLQVGSNSEPDAEAQFDKIVDDFLWLGKLGERHNVKVAYEPWCFSPLNPEWEDCWEVVKKVDHPFVGLCIDIAHIALGPKYGFDPCTSFGYTSPPSNFMSILSRLRSLPASKIFFYEVTDVILPSPALMRGSSFDKFHVENDHVPRLSWSFMGRCVPLVGKNAGDDVRRDGGPGAGEEGLLDEDDLGAARVVEITKAVFSTGFRGPCSWEVFEHKYMSVDDPTVPFRYAKAGLVSKEKLWDAIVDSEE
ncbi:xylose isomerase-like protein [Meredithblackwellia eburnea MCA 4105]